MKLMSALIAICLFVFSTSSNAQGIYKSPEDFEKGIKSYTKSDDQKYAIRTDIPFNRSTVKVVNGDETIKLQKEEVYGYADENNNSYRFYNNGNYRVLDQDGFLLYSRSEYVVDGKIKKRETRYYFSKDAGSQIIPLTIDNLKRAFPENVAFRDMLDVHFRNNKELVKFDRFNKQYKLKRVFSGSLS